ncbi:MAG: hypothetical protein KJ061_14085 [Vicinamibacteraceae bacterium]|nr:hypothetical protein [Vicinamibacteraceae bacterium]
MQVFSFGKSGLRAGVAALAFGMFVSGASVASAQEQQQPAQQPAQQEQAQQQQQQQQTPPAVTFSTSAGILFHQIKADRTADFEWVMDKLKAALLKSEDPVHQQQAGGIHVYKSTDPGQNGNVMYVVYLNPAVKEADYSMTTLLNLVYKAFPEEQQEIYNRVSGAFGGPTSRVNLLPVTEFANK